MPVACLDHSVDDLDASRPGGAGQPHPVGAAHPLHPIKEVHSARALQELINREAPISTTAGGACTKECVGAAFLLTSRWAILKDW